jgi:ABC-2 type transport system permease protein
MSFRDNIRTVKVSGQLGWAIEANWTHPILFSLYTIVRPIAASLILVFIYKVIAKEGEQEALFAFLYIGNAFYMFVTNVLAAISWIVHDDREHYQMARYIHMCPANIFYYFFGRGVAKILMTIVAVAVTLALGILVFGIEISFAAINYPFLLLALVFGIPAIVFLGVILAGLCLLTARHSFFMGEAVAAVFYLACGAIFPIDILPVWLQALSKILPLTYWLEAIRRSILGAGMSPSLSGLSNWQLAGIIIGSTLALAAIAIYFYRGCEYLARRAGKLDQVTNY